MIFNHMESFFYFLVSRSVCVTLWLRGPNTVCFPAWNKVTSEVQQNFDENRNLSGLSFLSELSFLCELFILEPLHKIQSRARLQMQKYHLMTCGKFIDLQEVICHTSLKFVTG